MVNETKEELSQKQLYNFNKLQKRLRHAAGKAIADFNMIEDGDRVMVCMSGGKDSYALLEILQSLKRSAPVDFELIPVHLNGMFPKYPEGIVENYLKGTGLEYHVIKENIHDIIIDKIPDGKNICSLCSRLRRGILYRTARELGITKIALGHHYDDVIETTLMAMLWSGHIETMMPKLKSKNYEGMELIRPMYYIREEDIEAWRDRYGLEFADCACKVSDSRNEEFISKRKETKELIRELRKTNPEVEANIMSSMENVYLDSVISYTKDGTAHSFMDEY